MPAGKKVVEEEAVVDVEETNDAIEQVEEAVEKPITKEEAEYVKKVFFEDDAIVTLRDGKSYRVPPLSLREGLQLMQRLNEVNTSIIVMNLIDDGDGNSFDSLVEVLLMAFKPYYPEMTFDYVADYVDLDNAKIILDTMIGLNQIKKNM